MKSLPKILVATLAVSLFVVITSEWQRATSPLPEATWEAAAKYLIKHAKDDTVLLHNGGSTEGLEVLQAAGLPVRLALPEPRGRIRRLWVVGRHRFLEQGLGELYAEEMPKADRPQGLYLTHFARAAGSALWRAQDHLLSASVRAAGKACRQPHNGGVRCAHLPDWMHVSPTRLNRSGATHDCLWAHPPSENRELTIRYDQIPSGALEFEHGLSDTASRSSNRQPVQVELRWEGGKASLKAGNNDGWRRSTHQVKGFLEVRVRARADGQRHHCFRGTIR